MTTTTTTRRRRKGASMCPAHRSPELGVQNKYCQQGTIGDDIGRVISIHQTDSSAIGINTEHYHRGHRLNIQPFPIEFGPFSELFKVKTILHALLDLLETATQNANGSTKHHWFGACTLGLMHKFPANRISAHIRVNGE